MTPRLATCTELPLGAAATFTIGVVLFYFLKFHFIETVTFFGGSLFAVSVIFWWALKDVEKIPHVEEFEI